jgi:hypothetical protein
MPMTSMTMMACMMRLTINANMAAVLRVARYELRVSAYDLRMAGCGKRQSAWRMAHKPTNPTFQRLLTLCPGAMRLASNSTTQNQKPLFSVLCPLDTDT